MNDVVALSGIITATDRTLKILNFFSAFASEIRSETWFKTLCVLIWSRTKV